MPTALVIETDVQVCKNLCQLLGLLDVHPRPAYNPGAARICLREDPPDLIFLSTCLTWDCEAQMEKALCTNSKAAHLPVVLVSDGTGGLDIANTIDVISRPATLQSVEQSLRRAGLI